MSLIMEALERIGQQKKSGSAAAQPRQEAGTYAWPRSHSLVRAQSGNVMPVLWSALAGILLVGAVWTVSSMVVEKWSIEPRLQAASAPAASMAAEEIPFEGIFWDQNDPICLIDGQIHHVGDAWKDKQIVAISQKEVVLQDYLGRVYHLKSLS